VPLPSLFCSPPQTRTTDINAAELPVVNGQLIADADAPAQLDLKPAREKENQGVFDRIAAAGFEPARFAT